MKWLNIQFSPNRLEIWCFLFRISSTTWASFCWILLEYPILTKPPPRVWWVLFKLSTRNMLVSYWFVSGFSNETQLTQSLMVSTLNFWKIMNKFLLDFVKISEFYPTDPNIWWFLFVFVCKYKRQQIVIPFGSIGYLMDWVLEELDSKVQSKRYYRLLSTNFFNTPRYYRQRFIKVIFLQSREFKL